jgi:hypothetical protein
MGSPEWDGGWAAVTSVARLIGIGAVVARRPCHTTVRTGPYTAARLVTSELLKQRWESERVEVRIRRPTAPSHLGSGKPQEKLLSNGFNRVPVPPVAWLRSSDVFINCPFGLTGLRTKSNTRRSTG